MSNQSLSRSYQQIVQNGEVRLRVVGLVVGGFGVGLCVQPAQREAQGSSLQTASTRWGDSPIDVPNGPLAEGDFTKRLSCQGLDAFLTGRPVRQRNPLPRADRQAGRQALDQVVVQAEVQFPQIRQLSEFRWNSPG